MPERTKRYCIEPGCHALTDKGRCDEHQLGSASQRGYDYRWLKYSRSFRRRYMLCGMGPRWPTPQREGAPAGCLAKGKLTAAAKEKPHHVDHIVPVRRSENEALFWNRMNHQTLCRACHFVKGKSERG